MAEKIVSPGVFTNEIDQSFLPATAGPIGAAIVGPTVKGPVLQPTVVNSYSEYVNTFGELIESGSDKYQYLTSHTAKEYLRQGGPLTVVRVAGTDTARATANVTSGSVTIFTLEALGDGPQFNNFVGTGSNFGTDNLLPVRVNSDSNKLLLSGSYGGRSDNFRFEISQVNLKKGTFTLLLRQGNDTTKSKKVIETHENLSLDPESGDYLLKRIGNQTTQLYAEDGEAFIRQDGDYPFRSNFVRVKTLSDERKTPNYLDDNGDVTVAYTDSQSFFPLVGSGSYGGAFGQALSIAGGVIDSGQTAG